MFFSLFDIHLCGVLYANAISIHKREHFIKAKGVKKFFFSSKLKSHTQASQYDSTQKAAFAHFMSYMEREKNMPNRIL